MVKGIARRIVLVKSPDKRIFEEAIFILREDALRDGGITAEDVLSEACRVARGYTLGRKARGLWRALPYVATGVAMFAAGWGAGMLV